MENEGIQLFINICIALIGLVVLRIGLQVWDRKAKAKEAEAEKIAKKKKK